MQGGADALLVVLDPFTFVHARRIVELATKQRLPAMYGSREPAVGGGLIAYGPNVLEMYRRSISVYVDKLLRGAKPADLCRATHELRARRQSQDGQGVGPHDPVVVTAARRSGYSIIR